jgi:hypothetical protein
VWKDEAFSTYEVLCTLVACELISCLYPQVRSRSRRYRIAVGFSIMRLFPTSSATQCSLACSLILTLWP